MKLRAAILYILLIFSFPPLAAAESKGLAVLELFTTQSCPSCPPADKFAKDMAGEDPELLVLGCHVSFIDSDQWKDTLAQPFCDARLEAYMMSIPVGRIATPTLVVNGQYDVVGPQEDLTRSAVKMVRSIGSLTQVPVEKTGENLEIRLPDMPLAEPADIWLFTYKSQKIAIRGGANANQNIDYLNAVTGLEKLLQWDGRHKNLSYPLGDLPEGHHAVLVQETGHGAIIAAGFLEN